MLMEKVFLNGKIIDAADAKVSVYDSGFLYGTGLFETMRAAGRTVFRLNDHIDRLFASAEKLGIIIGGDKKYIYDAVMNTLDANNLKEARLKLTVTNGSFGDGDEPTPTVVVTAEEFVAYPDEYYQKGVRVSLTDYRQNPADPMTGHKTICYNSRLLALKRAHQKNTAEALWFTTDNKLAEGCVSNVFIVKDGKVYTTRLDTPVLAGIARKTVCEIAIENNIELREQDIYINDLLSADEVFITNVIMGVLPVVAVEAHTVGDGKVGQLTQSFLEKYQQRLK